MFLVGAKDSPDKDLHFPTGTPLPNGHGSLSVGSIHGEEEPISHQTPPARLKGKPGKGRG